MRPVHLAVLRRWRLEGAGWRAGLGAVAASAAGWWWGAPVAWHLLAIAVAAAAAAAWPVRADERRALRWVGERVGLAYETAWELGERDGVAAARDARTAALRAAVAVQGRLAVRDLRPPPAAAWWLPLATLALGLWGWAAWSGAVDQGVLLGATPAGPPQLAGGPLGAEEPEAPAATEDEGDADLVDGPADAGGDRDAGAGGAPGSAGAPGGEGAASERDALERFLERLRERPAEVEDDRREAEAGLARGDGRPADGRPPDDAASRLDPGDRAETGRERLDGDTGDSDDALDAGDGEDANGGPEGEGDEDLGERGGEEPGADAAEQERDPAGAAGDEGAGLDGAEGEEGATGIGVGSPGEASDPAEPAAGDAEPLPSILGPGPEQAVGGVQLPGVAPEDDAFPAGDAGATFRRALEEALNEGDLPAPYLEVIRNYFR